MDLQSFAHDLVQDVTASSEAGSITTHDAFAERVLGDLETAGHIDDWYLAYYRTRGIEISGYGLNEGLGSIDLYLAQFRQQPLAAKVGKADLTALAKRAMNFLIKAREGLAGHLDESSEARDMALALAESSATVTGVRIFLITNDLGTVRAVETPVGPADLPVTVEIWDLQRLFRLATSGVLHESIAMDFDPPLPCLSTPTTDDNYSVFLLILRGDTLGQMYMDYGTRLLELNVRSFLQAKGAVNRGIRETLLHVPERFLAYNNGISATASRVEMKTLPDGSTGIGRIHDLQIVNGGQTTASIHASRVRNEADLSQVHVQMKLTVVKPEFLNEIVPEISRFSNTQNKVTVVDFSSNDPFHVELEKVTRTLWAPASASTGQETKWFYERARGQYADALGRERTPARQRAFKIHFPMRQKFLKTDVSKWENTWAQKPWIVSRGAEKNFRAFMLDQAGKTPTSNIDYVKRLIAKGILFRSAETVVTQQQFGGYRANIVTYSLAKLCNATSQRLDLHRVWRDQGISDACADAIAEISNVVNKVITEPAGGSHVGEWTKKEACWARVAALDWEPTRALTSELLDVSKAAQAASGEAAAGITPEEQSAIDELATVPAESWFALSQWAKETKNLEAWQRSLAFSIGRVAARRADPSARQAKQGVLILQAAKSLGFKP